MKCNIQLEAPSFLAIHVWPLDENHYQAAQEFIKLHRHAPWINDIPRYDDSQGVRLHFTAESQHINIKILDENSLIASEFKLYDLNHLPLTWAENEITHHVRYFWRKFGEDKPCLICRHYYDCEGCILWEHEIEVDEMPKKNDFEFKTVGVEVQDFYLTGFDPSFWNCLQESESLFFKKTPLEVTYSPAISELTGPDFIDCFLMDSKGEILKDFYSER